MLWAVLSVSSLWSGASRQDLRYHPPPSSAISSIGQLDRRYPLWNSPPSPSEPEKLQVQYWKSEISLRFSPLLVAISGNSLVSLGNLLHVLVFAGAAPWDVSTSSGKIEPPTPPHHPRSRWEVFGGHRTIECDICKCLLLCLLGDWVSSSVCRTTMLHYKIW